MKTISKLFGAVAAIAALAACNKEAADVKPVVPEGMQRITIKVNTPGTKVTLVDEASGDLQWSANEELEVKCLGYADTFTLTLNEDGQTFSGDIPAESTITDITYPGDPEYYNNFIKPYKSFGAQFEYNFDTTRKFPFPLHWTPEYGGDFENGITLFPDSFAFVRGSFAGVMAYFNYDGDFAECCLDLVVNAKKEGEDYEYSFKLCLNPDNPAYEEFWENAESDEEEVIWTYRFPEDTDKNFTFFVELEPYDELEFAAIHTIEMDGTDALLGHTGNGSPRAIAAIWGYEGHPMGDGNRYKIYKYAFNATSTWGPEDSVIVNDGCLNNGSISYGFTWGDINDECLSHCNIEKMTGADIKSKYYDVDYLDDETSYFIRQHHIAQYHGELITSDSEFIDNAVIEGSEINPISEW